jgi:hypothetical protein
MLSAPTSVGWLISTSVISPLLSRTFRSDDLIRALSNGLIRKSTAPCCIAFTAASTLPYAVITTSPESFPISFSLSITARPFIPGRDRSSTIASNTSLSSATICSSSSPLAAVSTSHPSSVRMSWSTRRMFFSSSQTTIRLLPVFAMNGPSSGEGRSALREERFRGRMVNRRRKLRAAECSNQPRS